MLQTDWRDDSRPFLVIDLEAWPADTPLMPLPPIPVLATGARDHPQAVHADILIGDAGIPIARFADAITGNPRTAAIIVQLLRAVDGLPPEQALPLESLAFAALQGGAEHARWLGERPPIAPQPPGQLHLQRDDGTLTLVIDRPAALNAIDAHMRDALFDAFALANADPTITRVRIRATGRAFSMGADLAEFGITRDPVEAHGIRAATLPAHQMIRRAEIYDVHVDGGCVGSGLEFAAFAGRLTASQGAWFQLPELSMGILPGFGGCVSIPRRIGRQRTAAMILSGKRIDARTALDWGLIDAIVDEPPVDPGRADQIGG